MEDISHLRHGISLSCHGQACGLLFLFVLPRLAFNTQPYWLHRNEPACRNASSPIEHHVDLTSAVILEQYYENYLKKLPTLGDAFLNLFQVKSSK